MSAVARSVLSFLYLAFVALHGATIYFAGDYESIRIHDCDISSPACFELEAENNHVTPDLVQQSLFNSMIGLSASFALLVHIIRFTYTTKLQATGFLVVSFILSIASLFFAARQLTIKFEDGSEELEKTAQGYLLGALVAAQTTLAFFVLLVAAHAGKFETIKGPTRISQVLALVVGVVAIIRFVCAAVLMDKIWLSRGGAFTAVNAGSFIIAKNALFESPITLGAAFVGIGYLITGNEITRGLCVSAGWLSGFLSLNTLYDAIKQLSFGLTLSEGDVLAVASLVQPAVILIWVLTLLRVNHDTDDKPQSSGCIKAVLLILVVINLAAFVIRIGLSLALKDWLLNCSNGSLQACQDFFEEANVGTPDLIVIGLLSTLLGIGSCFLMLFHLKRWRSHTKQLALTTTVLSVVVGVFALAYAAQQLDLTYDSDFTNQVENLATPLRKLEDQDYAFILAIFTLIQPAVQIVHALLLVCSPSSGANAQVHQS